MKTDIYENDLYILPENKEEELIIKQFLQEKKFSYQHDFSSVKNQSWYGKWFIDVFCGSHLRAELESYLFKHTTKNHTIHMYTANNGHVQWIVKGDYTKPDGLIQNLHIDVFPDQESAMEEFPNATIGNDIPSAFN